MARIKIDLASGVFEAEGDEKFLNELYSDFKNGIAENQAKRQLTQASSADSTAKEEVDTKTANSKKVAKVAGRRKESYSIVKDLDLSSKNQGQSLRDFYKEKAPTSGMERATVFVYYLEKKAGITSIAPDHIYTCYKEVGVPVPKALKQSLLDTASRKGSIDTSDLGSITLTTVGENMVEYDLPKKKESA